MRSGIWVRVVMGLGLACLSAGTRGAGLGEEDYFLPLVGRYGVLRVDARSGAGEEGRWRLVEASPGLGGGGFSSTTLVPGVEEVGVAGRVIAGRAKGGYFVLDAGRAAGSPALLGTRGEWEAALAAAGVTGEVKLAPPDVLAAEAAERVLRPWRFRMVKGALGLADDTWSLIVQLAGLVTSFLMGVASGRRNWSVSMAVGLGLVVNVVAQIFIAGGGPGACVGFVFLPALFVVAARLGKGVRWVVECRRAWARATER